MKFTEEEKRKYPNLIKRLEELKKEFEAEGFRLSNVEIITEEIKTCQKK